jgi:hypothetical protein
VPEDEDVTVGPRLEQLTFVASAAAERTSSGWRVAGGPGHDPAYRAGPDDVFDQVVSTSGAPVRPVHLVVLELGPTHVLLTGSGGDQVVAGDILAGERRAGTRHDRAPGVPV